MFVFYKITNEQKTRTPLNLERMAAIFEQTKDMGVLFGKGGLYGNVSNLFYFYNYCPKKKDKCFCVHLDTNLAFCFNI